MQAATTVMAADCQSTTLKSDHGNHYDQDPGQIRCKEERRRVTDYQWSRLRPPCCCTPYGRYATTKHRQTHPACACQPDMRFNYLTGTRTTTHLAIQWRSAHHFRYWFRSVLSPDVGRVVQSVLRLATGWTVRGSNPGGVKIFRTRPDRPWGPPSLLYNGYREFSGGKASEAWRYHPHPSSAEVKGRVELYLYSASGPSWRVLGWTLFTLDNDSYEKTGMNINPCLSKIMTPHTHTRSLPIMRLQEKVVNEPQLRHFYTTWWTSWSIGVQRSMLKGHTRYCRLVWGPHMEQ